MTLICLENPQDFDSLRLAVDRVLDLGARDEETVRLVALAARVLLETHREAEQDTAEAADLRSEIEDLEGDVYEMECRAEEAEEEVDALRKQVRDLGAEPCS